MTDQDSTTMADQPQQPHQSETDQPAESEQVQAEDHGERPDQRQPSAAAGVAVDGGSTNGQGANRLADGSPAAGDAATAAPGDGEAPHGGAAASRAGQLEREGEVAADFLEQLLDIADMDGDIDVDVDGDRAAVAIVDSEEGRVSRRLVGPDGKVLDALQELTRLAVQAATGERSRLMLDVAGHRAERRSALVEVARTVIAQVRATGEQQAMDPMTAFERKVVHDEVAAAGLGSDSEGVEPHRHVVVLPG